MLLGVGKHDSEHRPHAEGESRIELPGRIGCVEIALILWIGLLVILYARSSLRAGSRSANARRALEIDLYPRPRKRKKQREAIEPERDVEAELWNPRPAGGVL